MSEILSSDRATVNEPIWLDAPGREFPVLTGEVTADVCVIGMGGSGLTCVAELLAQGASVVALDAGRVGGAAAGRNGGFLLAGLAQFYHTAVARLGRARTRRIYSLTLDEISRIAADSPSAVRLVGSLRIADSDEELDDCVHQLEAMRADGFPAERYEGAEGRGLLLPTDGAFQPLHRCRLLAERADRAGARLYEHSRVTHVAAGEVRTSAGVVRAPRVVVAVDGRLEVILPELRTRVRTARLQMLGVGPTREVTLPRPVYSRWGLDYWQQLPDGSLAVGGGRDIGGEDEWTLTATPTPVVQASLESILRERLGVHAPITHRWAASVGYTADGLPVLAEVRPGVWAIGGYSATGNVLGALYGRAAATLAMGGRSEISDALLAP
jgi:glycine/D-amino acid oxidase-like deaminating enzyme